MNLPPSPDTIYDQDLLNDARYKILIAGAKSGEHSSFSDLWDRPSKGITITVCLNTTDRQSAEDALQEAFLKALYYLQFVDKPTFSVRCCRTAIDSALAIVGKKRLNPEAWMDWSVDGETWQHWKISDEMAKSDERSLREERKRHLTEAIRKLRPTLRSIVEIQQLRNGGGTPKESKPSPSRRQIQPETIPPTEETPLQVTLRESPPPTPGVTVVPFAPPCWETFRPPLTL